MNSKNRRYYFKPTYQRWCFIAGTLASLSLLSPVQAELNVPVIVTLKMPEQLDSGLTTVDYRKSINQLQEQFRNEVEREFKRQFWTIPAVAMEVDYETLLKIQENALVKSVETDVPHPHTLFDSTPIIGADKAWELGYSGAGQAVAVLDTGVDKTHPNLVDRVVSEACYSTTLSSLYATTLCPNGKEEQVGNGAGVACSGIRNCEVGTSVAGVVAANGSVKGVAKEADIIAIQVYSRFDNLRVCGLAGTCVLTFTSDQIAGLERVLELHEDGVAIAAVNMGLGDGNYSDMCNGAIQGIIDNLHAVGIATIVASGNGYHTNGIAKPACISSAISVGATTKSDTVADYSNSADILDLLAPGSDIMSTLPGGSTVRKSGTSMAAPHVAGAFAVLKSAAPDASVDDILRVLKITGTPIEDWRSGIPNPPRITPRINLKKALERLAPFVPPPATPDISVAPTSHDFGDVKVSESSSVTVTVSNTGDSDLEIGQLALTGGDFIISSDNCSNTTVAASDNCTLTITFEPQTEGAKSATLSIPSNDFDTPTVEIALSGNGILDVVTPAPASCQLHVLQDHGRNDSQLYTINPKTLDVNPLSKKYPGHDLEALATHPDTDMLYAASGNDGTLAGHLYTFNAATSELTKIGDTGFGDVPSIAFNSDGTLWGWVKGKGLITIDIETGQGTMEKEFPGVLVEDITWNNAGTHIYGSENTNLWVYEYATQTAKLACSNLPGETEALEMLPDGSLLLGIHGAKKIIQFQALNIETCEIVYGVDIPTKPGINDVEGIAWPINACSQPQEVPYLSVSINDSPDPLSGRNSILHYDVAATLSANAPFAATGVKLVMTLPNGVELQAVNSEFGICDASNMPTINCQLIKLSVDNAEGGVNHATVGVDVALKDVGLSALTLEVKVSANEYPVHTDKESTDITSPLAKVRF